MMHRWSWWIVVVRSRRRKNTRGEQFTGCRKRNEPTHDGWNVIGNRTNSIHKETSPFVIYFREKHSDNFRFKFMKFLVSFRANVDCWIHRISIWGRSEKKFTIKISNGWNKLRTLTVSYGELFKLPRERSQWRHLRTALNVIRFMFTFCSFHKKLCARD